MLRKVVFLLLPALCPALMRKVVFVRLRNVQRGLLHRGLSWVLSTCSSVWHSCSRWCFARSSWDGQNCLRTV